MPLAIPVSSSSVMNSTPFANRASDAPG
jgi:hypothetical protein